ncbi:MAG TPA: cytochrome c [Steroidobacteraceae bacterium]|jgi:mono/diheme cytochrome c family protein
MERIKRYFLVIGALVFLIAIGLFGYAWSGLYNIGADEPHSAITYRALKMIRSRSIQVRSDEIKVPKLDDPQLILKGAGQYAAMCTSCHLQPGVENSELRQGLYPQPPKLSKVHLAPQQAFWVIKHGIKMTAMPAWGTSHDDETIWSMVAFLEKLPAMTPQEYKDIVEKAPPDEDMDMSPGANHEHAHGNSDPDDDRDHAGARRAND